MKWGWGFTVTGYRLNQEFSETEIWPSKRKEMSKRWSKDKAGVSSCYARITLFKKAPKPWRAGAGRVKRWVMVMEGYCHYINWNISSLFNCLVPYPISLFWAYFAVEWEKLCWQHNWLFGCFFSLCFQQIKHCVLPMLCSRFGKGLLMGLPSFCPTLNPAFF